MTRFKHQLILVLNLLLILLSIKYTVVTPFTVMCLALYSFYLTSKVEEYKNTIINLIETGNKKIQEDKEKIEKDLNTLYFNQKTVLSVINSLRTRINNYYGKTVKTKIPSYQERLKSIERRESDFDKD
jgi:hypothetical protein